MLQEEDYTYHVLSQLFPSNRAMVQIPDFYDPTNFQWSLEIKKPGD